MAEKNKSGFHTVGDTDMEEYNRKIKEHRRKVLRRTVIVTAVFLLVLTGLGLYMALRHYENYDIMSTAERSDTDATHFTEFQGNILKYSNDGAFYLDAANELIWNQTYEMSSPKLDTCGNYLSIYDKGGTKIYILTPTKLVGSIETTMQIQQVCVAEQGTVAVLMKKDKAAYLALYDREGNSLAEGEIHGQNGGYPIAIALSNDAVKLAVSMININEGSVKSTIAFYNYGTVGQNEIDHCVGVNNYDDMVIPEMEFTSNDRMVAFGDTKAVIFEGAQKPQAIAEIPMDEKTKSIFYNEHYIGIVPSDIMRLGILNNYEERAVNLRGSDVASQYRIIANHLVNYNYLQNPTSDVVNAELEQMSNLYDGRVLIINSNFRIVKDTYAMSEGKTMISEEVIKCFRGESTTRYDKTNGYIEMTVPITETVDGENGQTSIVHGVILASASTDSIATTLDILSRKALILEIVMGIIIIGIVFFFSHILIMPFKRVTQAISEVKDGFTDEPISVPDYLETEHIVDAFNQLLGRMKVINDSRQEFVSNVSHELKTPMTSIKVLADSLNQQPDVPVELYQEFMQDITEEIERENKIINDLLSLVKMDKTEGSMDISAVDINELLETTLKRLRPIARKRDIEVVLESLRPVTAEVDEVKISQIFTNLVENAIKYNKEHGWVKVLLDADHQFFTVEVSDSGIGIPEEDYEHIYERFYRVDKSHSREIGGTGLGLAITRNAILLHRGSIKVSSVEGQGTTFTVKIPLSYIK